MMEQCHAGRQMAETFAVLQAALGDRYAVERELGAGGMATVYLARNVKHGREVALKVLRPELAAVLGAERFLQEIRISAQLDHPHILTLIDSGESNGFVWYVLPYVRAFGTLAQWRLARLLDAAGEGGGVTCHAYGEVVRLWSESEPPYAARADTARARQVVLGCLAARPS